MPPRADLGPDAPSTAGAVDVGRVVDEVDDELRSIGGPERAVREKAYLKSELVHYGAPVPAVRRVATSTLRRHPGLDHDGLLDLAEALWAAPVHERRLAAVELLHAGRRRLRAADVGVLERLLRECRTWALVDPLATNVVGALVEAHPELGPVLDRWAADGDVWIRRSALLALLGPLRRGDGDWERFCRYADAMLDEREFFVRKAIGWVLRDTGRRRPELVFDWLLPRAARASGVTLREAVKPLSDAQRAAVLAAR